MPSPTTREAWSRLLDTHSAYEAWILTSTPTTKLYQRGADIYMTHYMGEWLDLTEAPETLKISQIYKEL